MKMTVRERPFDFCVGKKEFLKEIVRMGRKNIPGSITRRKKGQDSDC